MHAQPDPLSDKVFVFHGEFATGGELRGFIGSRLAPVDWVDLVEQTLRDDHHDCVELYLHAKRRPMY